MMRVKIIGAGSAGMHHAHAARELGWDVSILDNSLAAISRLRRVYAKRYGAWDNAIEECVSGSYDLAVIATPPESHVALAVKETCPVLIEKPLCAPHQVRDAEQLLGRPAYVGYCHCLGETHSEVNTLTVEWREAWSYMLKAHPWLKDQHDTYLGSWERGGGPAWEHSHGLNLWQHVARSAGHGEVVNWEGRVGDNTFSVRLTTETGFEGDVLQDVTADPPVKRVLVNGYQYTPMRAFKTQLRHVAKAPSNSPIDIRHGLSTARILASIHPRPSQQSSRLARAWNADHPRAWSGL